MNVAAMMSTGVLTASPDTSLAQVVDSLVEGHITALPIVDERGRLLGVVSTPDILRAQVEPAVQGVEGWREARAGEVMNHPALTIGPKTELREAALQMLQAEVHRLFVVADGKLLGVVSQWDLVRSLASRTE